VKRAEYPERTCREPVSGEYQMYSCELAGLHQGPCASYSSQMSVKAREAWEAGQDKRRAAAPRASGGRRSRDG
jgi:hypothetical protein